jgi:hypothetical protein
MAGKKVRKTEQQMNVWDALEPCFLKSQLCYNLNSEQVF